MSPVGRDSLVTPELPLVCLDSPLLLLDCSARGGGGNGPEKENEQRVRIHISGVTKCVTKFLTLSKSPHCDSVKNFVTHFVTAEIWTLI